MAGAQELLAQLNGEMAGLAGRVRASLVRVETAGRGAGAGTVWHPDGPILTHAPPGGAGAPRRRGSSSVRAGCCRSARNSGAAGSRLAVTPGRGARAARCLTP